jgi:hypothetical protein
MEKRDKYLKIRVSASELALIKANAFGADSVSNFVRNLALKRKNKTPKIDPELVRAINGWGNNLNQIARAINQSGGLDSKLALNLYTELENISQGLNDLVP